MLGLGPDGIQTPDVIKILDHSTGRMMTEFIEDDLVRLHCEIERWLGKCLLRLQHYERMLKAVVEHREVSGPQQFLASIQAAHVAGTNRKTLGTLINQMLGSYLVSEASSPEKTEASDSVKLGAG